MSNPTTRTVTFTGTVTPYEINLKDIETERRYSEAWVRDNAREKHGNKAKVAFLPPVLRVSPNGNVKLVVRYIVTAQSGETLETGEWGCLL